MLVAKFILFASTTVAFSLPDVSSILPIFARKNGNAGSCPSVWNDVSRELTSKFLSNGQCNPDARATIRLVFHDCGAWNIAQGAKGGCDGSLILSDELNRNENKGLANIAGYIQSLATKYKVGVADMVVFAGNHATVTCPGGPQVQTYVGRKDSSTPAPDGLLPDVNAPAAELYQLFQDKGFSARDLAALLGAHSTSNQFNFNTSSAAVGLPQDSTPGVWDVKYYGETLKPVKGVVVFPSDAKLAVHPTVGKEFQGFVDNQGKWNGKFAEAMGKMTLFGSSGTNGLVDCTGALPKSTNVKREMRGMPLFAPRH
ncbi:class II peroxidase [Plenodomus tracheiphilus IPT5]|uniref:Peroxidase n=1 Tax=Plenodomus tracheiphilus IPT5 TaxID=1408161 RepID=A0A6A7B879_9PLEO|nr:class II peroxidase [Plenodomus tracheiphilus IPT5]